MFRLALAALTLIALAGTADAAAKKPGQNKSAASKPKSAIQTAAAKAKTAEDEARTAAAIAMMQAEKIKLCSDAKPILLSLVSSQYVLSKTASSKDTSILYNPIERGEYETTAEFEERRDLFLKVNYGEPKRAVFFGDITGDDQTYDADSQVLELTLPSGTHSGQLSKEYSDRAISIHYEEKYNGVVNGQTRMGIKFKYKSYTATEYFLVLTGLYDSVFNKDSQTRVPSKASFQVDRDKAIKLRTSLRIAIIGEASAPYVDFKFDEAPASLDDPIDIVSNTLAYYVNPKCGYIFDGVSGEVYQTLFEYDLEPVKLPGAS